MEPDVLKTPAKNHKQLKSNCTYTKTKNNVLKVDNFRSEEYYTEKRKLTFYAKNYPAQRNCNQAWKHVMAHGTGYRLTTFLT